MILLPVLAHGQQNLVPNGDFESYSNCGLDNIYFISNASPWHSPTTGSPDYFNACCPPHPTGDAYFGVPDNTIGFQDARSGDGYAGFFAYSLGEPNLREYIQVELIHPLVYGIRYEVCFHVSLVDHVWYAINTLGAHISDMAITRNDILRFEEIPQIINPSENSLANKTEWVAVCDTFIGRTNNERFITIGNFHDDTESGTMFIDSGATPAHSKSYYYIDDVSVIALDSIPSSLGEAEALEFNVFPNPATGMVQVQGQRLAGARLLDMAGRCLVAERIISTTHTMHLHGIPPGLYLIEVTDAVGIKAVQKLLKQ